ncbi:MAG: hypothetical protein WEB79_08495, partial [Thermoleophilaceae bacterium]
RPGPTPSRSQRPQARQLAEYARRCVAVFDAQAQLRAAEDAVYALRDAPGARKVLREKTPGRYGGPDQSDLDADVLVGVPEYPKSASVRKPIRFHERTTADGLREVAAAAERRATAEANGEGENLAGVPTAAIRERQARREADRKERAA